MNRDIALSGSFNFRDLGGYPSPQGIAAWRKVFRSGSLAKLDQVGKNTLKTLRITRVIDLRSALEREAEPDPVGAEEAIELLWIPLFDGLNPGVSSGPDVLLHRYIEALKSKGPTFVRVIRAISSSPDGVLFHCTAGKDRTGLVAALVLALLGVDESTIINDYVMSAERIQPLLEWVDQKARALNLNPNDYAPMLACKAEMMRAALDWLFAHYQSVEQYLQNHGFTAADVQQLRTYFGVAGTGQENA